MNEIRADERTLKKALCPFCSYACDFAVVFDDFGVKGVEYLSQGNTNGRLCPRGSAAAYYLNHPRRLAMPLKDGRPLEWSKIGKELKKIFEDPEKVAVSFDRNITFEEYEALVGFCNSVGVTNVASSYLEPEALLKRFVSPDNNFNIKDLETSQFILVLGDPFNYAPMISKELINWKLRDRKNRLVVIDSIGSHTSVFASQFLKTKLGTEPIVLSALAQQDLGNLDVLAVTGLAQGLLDDVSHGLKQAKAGFIIALLPFGHTYDPLFFVEALSRVSNFSGKRVVPFFEFAGFKGNDHFGAVIELAKNRKIKHLVNFGELFPYYYPQIQKLLKGINIIATSPVKQNSFTTLPFALNLEKQGSIMTTFGTKRLSSDIIPASGARTVPEILSLIGSNHKEAKGLVEPEIAINVKERIEKIMQMSAPSKKKKAFKLIGEKIAYSFLDFFEKETIKMNPIDGADMGIKAGELVWVESKNNKTQFPVRFTKAIDSGVVVLPAETVESKALFDFQIDNRLVNFIPTEVEVWRKE